jgi:hypothetical protein
MFEFTTLFNTGELLYMQDGTPVRITQHSLEDNGIIPFAYNGYVFYRNENTGEVSKERILESSLSRTRPVIVIH